MANTRGFAAGYRPLPVKPPGKADGCNALNKPAKTTTMNSCLQATSLTKSFGQRVLFRNLSLFVGESQRVGLIARNGTGKSTLLEILAGRQEADSGEVVYRNGVRVGYLPQAPEFAAGLTVLEACFRSDNAESRAIAAYERALVQNDATALETAAAQMDALEAWGYEQRCRQILSLLKITDFTQRVETLSGGQRKRVALAAVLIGEPDLLILDEPTNHLDLDMTLWLEEALRRHRGALLMVTHDRRFLDSVCSDIAEIDSGKVYTYAGNYSYYLEKRQERLEAEAAQRESDENRYRRELDWMRRQPQARAGKARYRIDAFRDLEERRNARGGKEEQLRLEGPASYVGKKIFEAKHVSKRFGERMILEDFSYVFSRYEKMGIVGANGTGKTTFLRMLLGQEPPDGGSIDIGETVRFGYYSQQGMDFDENMKVIDAVTAVAEEIELGGKRLSASQFLQHFLFSPAQQHDYVARLSGGERRRLYLCTVLLRNPNFLVLDEPTNDLDIATMQVLEDYLESFAGCLIVVSHDRCFMDRVADHLLVFRGDGRPKDFPGSFTEYIAWEREQEALHRAQEAASVPIVKPTAREMERPRKLSYKERKEYESLEAQIAGLEAEKAELEKTIGSGILDLEALTAASHRIGALLEEIDVKTMRWLELDELA